MTSNEIQLIHPDTLSRGVPWSAVLGYGSVVLGWLILNRTAGQWLIQALPEWSPVNQILMIGAGIVLLFCLQISLQIFLQFSLGPFLLQRYRAHLKILWQPEMRRLPLLLILGSGVLSLGSQWFLTLEQIPAILFILGSYGLVGLWLQPHSWNRGLPIAIALSFILPFGVEFSTNLGFPARILTAEAVEQILHHLKIAALSSEDIIVLDTGIAHVELPCSGLKSLWIGSLFFLGATWVDRRRLGLRWLGMGAVTLGLLVLANIARVLSLVMVAEVLQQPEIADILHIPLGIIGFITVCGLSYGLLRGVPQITGEDQGSSVVLTPQRSLKLTDFKEYHRHRSSSYLDFLVLTACLLGLALFPAAPSFGSALPDLNALDWPANLQMETIPLSKTEQRFFGQNSGVLTEKQRFQFQDLSGSVLFVASSTCDRTMPQSCV
ncbi:MAG: exosortase O [Oscillatoriales cyanobacterium RM2_1_1]|nr:exosortase O [Oscillatoriales cyanobacterium RM2_1_1]